MTERTLNVPGVPAADADSGGEDTVAVTVEPALLRPVGIAHRTAIRPVVKTDDEYAQLDESAPNRTLV
ncbi:hypothetical protein ACWDFR_22530 [Streptomyces sp. 900105755]